MEFGGIKGQAEYTEELRSLYAAEKGAWLTPVEIFAPWYSRAIGRWLVADVAAKVGDTGATTVSLRCITTLYHSHNPGFP